MLTRIFNVLASIFVLQIIGFANASFAGTNDYPKYFSEWLCDNRTVKCNRPWGMTALGKPSLSTLNKAAFRNSDIEVRFVQYSRANDDTPGGADPTAILKARYGNVIEEKKLLDRGPDGQLLHREELLLYVYPLIDYEPAFYEVATVTFAVVAGKKPKDGTIPVSFVSLLESTSGRYENASEVQGFKFNVHVNQRNASFPYKTFYQNGAKPNSSNREKMGTLSISASSVLMLPTDRNLTVTADLTAPNGKVFKQCQFDFKLPFDGTTSIKCERFKFPPLLVARSNVRNARPDRQRYRKPPVEGECFSQETVGNGGMSNNSMMAALFRDRKTCVGCHAVTPSNPSPEGGDLLCPQKDGGELNGSFGMPKNPPLIANVVKRYFFNPSISEIPKNNPEMKGHFDILRDAYCHDYAFNVTERGQLVTKSARKTLEGWVREFDNPSVLNFEKICQ